MSEIKMAVPDRMPLALGVKLDGLAAEIRMAAAVKLYELERLSSGAAAELAGIPLPVFLMKLGDYGVATFRLTREELEADMENA